MSVSQSPVRVLDVVISSLAITWIMEETLLVRRVVMPGEGTGSWTVLGDDDVLVGPSRDDGSQDPVHPRVKALLLRSL